MPTETIPFAGWERNVRLFNAHAEAIITLEVGPRVLSYRTLPDGENLFKRYNEQLGGRGEVEWKIRGGHRFWVAPEDLDRTYALDNGPVEHTVSGDTVTLRNAAFEPFWLEKTLTVTLAPDGPALELDHVVTNRSPEPVSLAPWALTVMKPGGTEVIPQPPLGEHPRDLLPNRRVVVWPYTALNDARWRFGTRLWTLRQEAGTLSTKIGLAHSEGWAGYVHDRTFFCKTVTPPRVGEHYPDDGCNFETYSNHEMLEIESLGPLVTLAPGESASHQERWFQHEFDAPLPLDDEAALADALWPVVRAAKIL